MSSRSSSSSSSSSENNNNIPILANVAVAAAAVSVSANINDSKTNQQQQEEPATATATATATTRNSNNTDKDKATTTTTNNTATGLPKVTKTITRVTYPKKNNNNDNNNTSKSNTAPKAATLPPPPTTTMMYQAPAVPVVPPPLPLPLPGFQKTEAERLAHERARAYALSPASRKLPVYKYQKKKNKKKDAPKKKNQTSKSKIDNKKYNNNNSAPATSTATLPETPQQNPPLKRPRKIYPDPHRFEPFNDMLYQLLLFRAANQHCCIPMNHELFPWVIHLQRQYQRAQDLQLRFPIDTLDPHGLTEDRVAVLNSISFSWFIIDDAHNQKWEEKYVKLVQYKQKYGHCVVSQKFDNALYKWAQTQRLAKQASDERAQGKPPSDPKIKPLSYPRIVKLEQLGFQWEWKKQDQNWDVRFQQLLQYKQKNGHCNVPQHYIPDRAFGKWVSRQRNQYTIKQRGEQSALSDDRQARLTEIGFQWAAPGFKKGRGKVKRTNSNNDNNNDDDNDDDDTDTASDDESIYANNNNHHNNNDSQMQLNQTLHNNNNARYQNFTDDTQEGDANDDDDNEKRHNNNNNNNYNYQNNTNNNDNENNTNNYNNVVNHHQQRRQQRRQQQDEEQLEAIDIAQLVAQHNAFIQYRNFFG